MANRIYFNTINDLLEVTDEMKDLAGSFVGKDERGKFYLEEISRFGDLK